jgi:hypothetical protein
MYLYGLLRGKQHSTILHRERTQTEAADREKIKIRTSLQQA